MPYFYFFEESHERGKEHRGGVSLGQEQLRLVPPDDPAKPLKAPLSHVVEALPLLHDLQIVVGLEAKHIQNLVYQAFVLPREHQAAIQIGAVPQRFNNRCHFDGLGPRSDYHQDARWRVFGSRQRSPRLRESTSSLN